MKRPWCWVRLKVGGEGDDRGWDDWMASLTRWTWVWVNSGNWWEAWRAVIHGVAKSRTQLSDWTELNMFFFILGYISCSYILKINPLSVSSLANNFSHSIGCLFTLFMVSFAMQKLVSLIRPHYLFFILFLLLWETVLCLDFFPPKLAEKRLPV